MELVGGLLRKRGRRLEDFARFWRRRVWSFWLLEVFGDLVVEACCGRGGFEVLGAVLLLLESVAVLRLLLVF